MHIVYNGVTLPFQLHKSLESEFVSENGHYVVTRYRLEVSAVLNVSQAGIALPGETFAATIARLQHMLEQPRCPLAVYLDDTSRPIAFFPGGRDVETGPTPGRLVYHTFAGTQAVHLTYSIGWSVRNCPEGGEGPPWTYHGWGESLDLDQSLQSTLTRTGLLRLRGDRPVWADDFRDLVLPRVPRGFVRQKVRFDVQEDGLAVKYQVTDREVYAQPPPGAQEAEGDYELASVNAAKMLASVRLRLKARNDYPKARLLETAITVAMERLTRGVRPNGPGGKWLILGGVSEGLYQNEVRVQLRVDVTPPQTTAALTGFDAVLREGQSWLGQAVPWLGKMLGKLDKAKRRKKAGEAAEPDAVPRGTLADGFGPRPLFSEVPRQYGPDARGSAGLLVLLSRALEDPCRTRLIQQVGDPPQEDVGLEGDQGGRGPDVKPRRKPDPNDPDWPTTPFDPNPPEGGYPWPGPQAGAAGGRPAEFGGEGVASLSDGPDWGAAEVFEVGRLPTPEEWRAGEAGGGEVSSCDGFVWLNCQIEGAYLTDTGVVARTEQRAGGLTHPVTVRAKRVTYECKFHFERAGRPPELPPEASADPNLFLVGVSQFVPHADLAPDGVTPLFSLSGVYTYAVRDPAKVVYRATAAPWVAELVGLSPLPALVDGPEVVRPNDGGGRLTTDESGKPAWEAGLDGWAAGGAEPEGGEGV